MTGKRSRLEMYLDILEEVNSGINRPTNIMYKCNLSWIPLKEILNSMIDKGLLKMIEKGNKRTYEITERGKDLLRYFGNVLDVLTSRGCGIRPAPDAHTKSKILARLNFRRSLPPISQHSKPNGRSSS